VGELDLALERRFPSASAEPWDRVGLIVGDRQATVTGVRVTLDASAEAVERTAAGGGSVLVSHHPPYLTAPEVVRAASGPEGTLEVALRLGVAVIALHTSADRSAAGASALASALGLTVIEPLESAAGAVSVIVTYAPPEAEVAIREAMAGAGAGTLGAYYGCAFTVPGTGRFNAQAEAAPALKDPGTGVREVRIEMIAPPQIAEAVLGAVRAVHPYEEPVILAMPGQRARGALRLGRLCSWHGGQNLGELAAQVSRVLGVSCRVWGDAARPVFRIAVANGSAGSLLGDARRSADVLIAGEVRYHDALTAVASGLAVIETGHDSSEWPLVAAMGEMVGECLGGRAPLVVEPMSVGWWTMEDAHVGG